MLPIIEHASIGKHFRVLIKLCYKAWLKKFVCPQNRNVWPTMDQIWVDTSIMMCAECDYYESLSMVREVWLYSVNSELWIKLLLLYLVLISLYVF